MSRNVPRKPPYPPARLPRRQADEYSESEREESEYETDGEDIEHSPPRGREDELDEEEEYEEEVEEEAPLSDEEMEVKYLLASNTCFFPCVLRFTFFLS
jgi:RNA polymerase-associated protein LEO1